MDTLTLCRLACSDPYIKKGFAGVYASDSLPKRRGSYKSFIVNLDAKHLAGSHWIGIFFSDHKDKTSQTNSAFYFDSYGRFATDKNILKFLTNNAEKIDCNFYGFQNFNTFTCGHFCLYFLYQFNRSRDLHDLSRTQRGKNEIFIKAFVSSRLKLAECCDSLHRENHQTCQAVTNIMQTK